MRELVLKYIQKTEKAFENLKITQDLLNVDRAQIKEVIAEAERYLTDSKYYLCTGKFETSLASVAYSEGLLDALRILKFVDFSW
jgi:FAD synthetase